MTAHQPDAMLPETEWLKIEYDQIHQYGRAIFDTIQRLAQMTFVINPALTTGYYFVLFQQKDNIIENIGIVGFTIALASISLLGAVYNAGAFDVYVRSHVCLEALLIRMREIDESVNMKTHQLVETTAPRSYKTYWGQRNTRPLLNADYLTRLFLAMLSLIWVGTLLFSAIKFGHMIVVRALIPPGS
jgi:hypothetical protein